MGIADRQMVLNAELAKLSQLKQEIDIDSFSDLNILLAK